MNLLLSTYLSQAKFKKQIQSLKVFDKKLLIFQLITGQLCSQPSYDRLKDEQFLNGHFLNLDFIFEFYFCFSLKEVCTHALLKTWVLFPFLFLFTCAYLDGARLLVYNFAMFCFRNNKSLISMYCHIFYWNA